MRGSVKDRFGLVRGDALGVNPAENSPVIATHTPIVEDEAEADGDKKGVEEARTKRKESDSPTEGDLTGDDDGGRKPPAKKVSKEDVADAEEGNTTSQLQGQSKEALPPGQQMPTLFPTPPRFPGGLNPQQLAPGIQPAELAAALSMNKQNMLPVGTNTLATNAVGLNGVAPTMQMGWAALAALQQGLGRTQTPAPPLPAGPQTLLYTVGFGIDPRQSMHNNWDATEAAVRALRDAMERSTVRLPPNPTGDVHRSPFQIHVKIGVPPRTDVLARVEPMVVDMSRVASVLPRSIPILPVDVVVGGLAVSGKDDPDMSICTAVACVTVQTNADTQRHAWEKAAVAAVQQQQMPAQSANVAVPAVQNQQQPRQTQAQPVTGTTSWKNQGGRRDGAAAGSSVDSMAMLARISEEVRERPSSLGALGDRLRPDDVASPKRKISPAAKVRIETAKATAGENLKDESPSAYKKLPPGKTDKNNRRLFVKHKYHDHSLEKPPSMADTPIYSARGKTVGTAFPVKLHEMLDQIEKDGYSDIISWLPHGRCFKIHKQQEFLDIILPNYCQMTKKSSFLRQLNLYGFNRFSAGPDKGAYYHELFLRGMLFLCRRMVRMKVNGNGIRAAGNPETEPNFYAMPTVPQDSGSTDEDSDEEEDEEEGGVNKSFASKDQLKNTLEHVLMLSTGTNITDSSSKARPSVGNNNVTFPVKLQAMLDKLEADGNVDTVSWLSHGRAFLVHNQQDFVKRFMPEYFRQTKYSSFQRQLHMYTFQRITAGRDKGAYFHASFLRGKPNLAQKMVRTKINGKGTRRPGDPSTEPNFYALQPMDAIPRGTIVEVPMDFNVGDFNALEGVGDYALGASESDEDEDDDL